MKQKNKSEKKNQIESGKTVLSELNEDANIKKEGSKDIIKKRQPKTDNGVLSNLNGKAAKQ